MLQGVHNPELALDWNAAGRPKSGTGPVFTEGYSQDDIKNGFRVDSLTPKPLGDRVKMGCAALFSVAIPLLFLVALLFITGSWLNLTWQTLTAEEGINGLALAVFVVGDLFLLGFLYALYRRLSLIRRQSKSFYVVTTESQPELHAFICHIADMLGAPTPKSVKLDAEVGLILRPTSLRDALSGEGPEVVIGLPLLYGLSVRQLSGVIAHAYAGYSREARLQGYPVLSSVDRWLFTQTGLGRLNAPTRSDFEAKRRSRVDTLFKPWDVLVQGTFYVVYRVVSSLTFDVSRKVDMAGDLLSARVAGSTEFRSTQFRLRSLHYGQVNANQELVGSWRTKKLSDNFPALVVDHADTLQLSLRPRLIQEMEELVTPLTRSRIVDLGRIVNVEHTQEEGACFLLGAAISLLREPAKVSKAVTLAHYRYIGIRHPDVYTTQKVQSIQKAEREKAKRHQVFLGLERSGRIVRVDEFEHYQANAVESQLVDYRILSEKLRANEAEIAHAADTIRELEFRKNLLHTRKVLEECKDANGTVLRDLEVQWLTLIKDQSEYKSVLATYESSFSRKAAIALSLALETPVVQEQLQMSRHELHSHFVRLVDALSFLHRSFESIQRLRSYTQVLGQLLVEIGSDARVNPVLVEMSNRYQRYMMIELDALIRVFSGVAYPLGGFSFRGAVSESNDAGLLTVGDVVREEVPDLDSAGSCPEACHRVANTVCQYLDSFNEELQQRLTGIVTSVDHCYPSLEDAPR
ncbi:M48 family metallopeptidase [Ketobacter sp.]|uniref:M48 family metallopeptidase n=1 Tax=Ketobacter sp. TaxID=2083498 RepID=UPI000F109B33|nr:M48 family metallopeptidase [Ketobacter sp.]RLU01479.1 MAG: hypothetical protein D9N14_01560 [Ketobacter sp.]